MRIIFICNEFPPAPGGGIGTIVKTMAQSLVASGVNVIVIGYDVTIKMDQTTEENGILVFRLFDPYIKSKQLRCGRFYLSLNQLLKRMHLSRKVEALIQRYNPDVIESYDWSGPLWRKPSVPLVVRMHGAHAVNGSHNGRPSSKLLSFFEQRNLKQADALCAVSQYIALATKKTFSLKGSVEVIYNSTDTNKFRFQETVDRDFNKLLYVGRIVQQKGLDDLFKMINFLFDLNSKLYLVLAGSQNLEYQLDLLRQIDANKRDRIKFIGHIDNDSLPLLYSSAGIFLMPSKAEAFGITAIEAMSCCTPVVITDSLSGPEIVDHGESGYLIDFENSEEAARQIGEWLLDRSMLSHVGMKGRAKVKKEFSNEVCTMKNIDLYNTLLRHGI